MNDVSLPKLAVLDSEMAYREAGGPQSAGRALPARQPDLVLHLAQHPAPGRAGRPLRRPRLHRLRPVGQAGHRLSFRGSSPLSRRLHRENGDRLGLSRRPGLGNRRSPFTWPSGGRISCAGSCSWSSCGRSRPGTISCEARAREIFRQFRTPGEGEKLILEDNFFVERILPGGMRHKLTDEEMAVYRAPFPTPESRRPTWRFPNEIPIAGEPADVAALMSQRMPRWRPRPIRSSSSPPSRARSSRRRSPRTSPASSQIAGWSSSETGFISCRRITPRRSGGRSRLSSPRSKAAGRRARRAFQCLLRERDGVEEASFARSWRRGVQEEARTTFARLASPRDKKPRSSDHGYCERVL